jgi:hypothetical protein
VSSTDLWSREERDLLEAIRVIREAEAYVKSTYSNIPPVRIVYRIRGAVATYVKTDKVIYVSAKSIMDVLRKHGRDYAFCEALSILIHELRHHIDIARGIRDVALLERNALWDEITTFKRCIEEKKVKIA